MLVPAFSVVEVFDLVDRVALQARRSGGLGAAGGQREIRLLVGAVDLQLVDARLRTGALPDHQANVPCLLAGEIDRDRLVWKEQLGLRGDDVGAGDLFDHAPIPGVVGDLDFQRGRHAIGVLPLAVAGEDDAPDGHGLGQLDLDPAGLGAANPAPGVAVLAVVDVLDLVDGVALQRGRGAGLGPAGGQREVLRLAGTVDLQLVDARQATVAAVDDQPHEPRLDRLEEDRVRPGRVDGHRRFQGVGGGGPRADGQRNQSGQQQEADWSVDGSLERSHGYSLLVPGECGRLPRRSGAKCPPMVVYALCIIGRRPQALGSRSGVL